MLLEFYFFFQAEDGIRDLVRSRGLGDVYKRQELGRAEVRLVGLYQGEGGGPVVRAHGAELPHIAPVSYTHLTLPTIYSV